ncbi:MAG: transglutaminase [Nitrospirae bacterium GWF2_44_13]|nr:MAG: transglutaminase [Nitrospirae bacterium GWF2_44_13]OGW66482.1 MAG: transglutaminase [Nitrospirae bacterium RIFOXYA2_FULL_44_9]HBG92280.1 transglutaminase [Nitrospiraceae bacterium]HBU05314.1 transglutaminase [Nitrospiraceae bacterium]
MGDSLGGKRLMAILIIFLCMVAVFSPLPCSAKTLILDGDLESRIKMSQQVSFDVQQGVKTLTFKFALPTEFSNKATSQSIDGLNIKFTPEPVSVVDDIDKFGNRFKKARWENLKQSVNVTISFNAGIKAELRSMESTAAFPLNGISGDDAVFLKPTQMVQSENEEIIALSRRLTANARTTHDAVNAILNWVADNVKYTYNPPQYDAIHTMKTGRGNCQNFAHLSMALLRAAGIPSRIVGGISLKRQWKVPVENGYLVQDMGQGGHAWMEIFFPDLGWLSYDPQQSRQFTSTRHIKQTHGLDSKDINDSWSASPYLPKYSEDIEAVFNNDNINIKLRASKSAPASYIMSNNLMAKAVYEKPLPPVVKPLPPIAKPEPPVRPPPKKKGIVEFGNMEFPTLVDAYQTVGNVATRILDKETAEYVTSRYVYAQAFTVTDAMTMYDISLALRKFGGDGTLYIDVVKDENGKPGFTGERSLPVYLGNIRFRPGYYWVNFVFAKGNEPSPVLKPGKYWIILRHSGEAIVNWFFIPGNAYGDGDDTRSTVKGYKWEDLLNYDFVFKVKGRV